MSAHDFFNGKKVTVMGLGLLGRGVGDVRFIAGEGAEVLVTDMKTEEQLEESVTALKGVANIMFHLGGHKEEDFTDVDMVIKAAGVPLDSPYIAAARKAGVPVHMSTALAAKFAQEQGATIIGITGTRGKSTVTQMIYHTLKSAGKDACLGGNVRGISTLDLMSKVTPYSYLVLELDSWQLQGFGDLRISPHIAVFTNLMPDHQNYYPDMQRYFNDKKNIYAFQNENDVLVVGKKVQEEWIRESRARVPELFTGNLQVEGEHNRENASLAAEALRAVGLSEEHIEKGLATFESVEGRLQLVKEINGVTIYNDNNATTPEATIAALKAVSNGKNVILVMGGSDKGLDMSKLLYEITKTCKRVILLPGTGTNRIVPLMQDYSIFDSLENALNEAVATAQPGDVILFSPAFASFGPPPGGFKNEYERNDQFMRIVTSL